MSVLAYLKTQRQKNSCSNRAWTAAWPLCVAARGRKRVLTPVTWRYLMAVGAWILLHMAVTYIAIAVTDPVAMWNVLPTFMHPVQWPVVVMAAGMLAMPTMHRTVYAMAWQIHSRADRTDDGSA